MATFQYTARNVDGNVQNGTLIADSEAAAARVLDDRGLYPIKLSAERVEQQGLSISRRVKLPDLVNFYNQLGDLLSAGVPMLRGLDTITRQGSSRVLTGIVRELREDVAGGSSLADAMERHGWVFPELHVGMVRAGEQGGFLHQVLHRLALFVDQRDQLRNKVIGSMMYPVFLLLVGVTVVIVLVTYFMPKLAPLFEGMEVPALTRWVMAFGQTLQEYFWVVFFVVILAISLVLPYIRSLGGRRFWDRISLRLPVVGRIFLMVSICRFCRVLGTLVGNGVAMLPALHISRESAGNSVLAELVGEAAEGVRAGKSLAETFRTSDIFPGEFVEILAVAEETNRLSEVLIDLAERNEQRVSRRVDTAVRMLEPAMLVVVFIMVFVIALALLLPILRMSSAV